MNNDMFFLTQENETLPEFLIACINNQCYAFDIKFLIKIIQLPSFASIEKTPPNAVGIINLHGENIAVYDFKTCLGLEQKEFSSSQQVLVFNINDKKFAVIVDKTGEIITADLSQSQQISYNSINTFLIAGFEHNNQTIILTDMEQFIQQFDSLEATISNPGIKNPSSKNELIKLEERAVLLKERFENTLSLDFSNIEKFLIFSLNQEYYCFSIRYVKKIKSVSLNSITPIPCTPPYIKGIINFRGDYICLIDIKNFLGIDSDEEKDKFNVIILKIDKYKLAILIDDVIDIKNLPFDMVQSRDDDSSFIIGELFTEDNKLINILNVEKLFSSENINIEEY